METISAIMVAIVRQVFYSNVMPLFTICDHYESYSILTLWIVFWNVRSLIFFSLLCGEKETLKAIALLLVSNIFQSIASEWKFASFHSYWFIKDLIFEILSGCFAIFCVLMQLLKTHIFETRIIIIFLFIVDFFVFDTIRKTNVWSTTDSQTQIRIGCSKST